MRYYVRSFVCGEFRQRYIFFCFFPHLHLFSFPMYFCILYSFPLTTVRRIIIFFLLVTGVFALSKCFFRNGLLARIRQRHLQLSVYNHVNDAIETYLLLPNLNSIAIGSLFQLCSLPLRRSFLELLLLLQLEISPLRDWRVVKLTCTACCTAW